MSHVLRIKLLKAYDDKIRVHEMNKPKDFDADKDVEQNDEIKEAKNTFGE